MSILRHRPHAPSRNEETPNRSTRLAAQKQRQNLRFQLTARSPTTSAPNNVRQHTTQIRMNLPSVRHKGTPYADAQPTSQTVENGLSRTLSRRPTPNNRALRISRAPAKAADIRRSCSLMEVAPVDCVIDDTPDEPCLPGRSQAPTLRRATTERPYIYRGPSNLTRLRSRDRQPHPSRQISVGAMSNGTRPKNTGRSSAGNATTTSALRSRRWSEDPSTVPATNVVRHEELDGMFRFVETCSRAMFAFMKRIPTFLCQIPRVALTLINLVIPPPFRPRLRTSSSRTRRAQFGPTLVHHI